MKIKFAYRLHTKSTLFSFDDLIEEVPINGISLKKRQDDAFLKHGIKIIDILSKEEISEKNSFLFDNNLFFTPEFVKSAINNIVDISTPLRFCLKTNTFNQHFILPSNEKYTNKLAFNFYFNVKGSTQYKDCTLSQVVYKYNIHLPKELAADPVFHFDQCDTFITIILSPFHLLQSNLAMLTHRNVSYIKKIPNWILKKMAPVHSPLFYMGLRLQNKIGNKCRIHKTAVIEGATIGDNVTIGAYAVVRMSSIGDNTTLEDHATVHYSVLGENNYIAAHNHAAHCMTYNDVFLIHGPYQFSIFGRNCNIFATINCDIRLDKKHILIPTEYGLINSGLSFLGIAYGHNCKIGAGTIIAPGRIVPNGKHINPPAATITSF